MDTGATRLVLPASVVAKLGLPENGQVTVKFADGRREHKTCRRCQLEIQGRYSVFTAVVEPGRTDALIGAIVLQELDFVPDFTRQAPLPRDPHGLFAEIE